jgi:hypothetical protein
MAMERPKLQSIDHQPGDWFLRFSTLGYAVGQGNWTYQWGVAGDQPVAGDFDGDRKTDIAVYRPTTGEWFLRLSSLGYAVGQGNWTYQWGRCRRPTGCRRF